MKKENIKKTILFITLIPYIHVLVMCIYYAIFGYRYDYLINLSPEYGLSAVGAVLNEYWFNGVIINFNYKLLLIILCIIYQVYYIITYKKAKVIQSQPNINKSQKADIKKILFIISIICWIIYFLTGIYAFYFGSKTGGSLFYPEMEYGLDALQHTLIWNLLIFSAIPILPISLTYIIIYLIIKHKNKKTD